MIDIIGAIVLTVFAVGAPTTLILSSRLEGAAARRLGAGVAAWFVGIITLAAAGLFSAGSGVGTPALGAAVLAPVLAVTLSTTRLATARRLALGIPLAALVVVNAGRVLGTFFVWLGAEGRLPPTFAVYAGWGDVLIGALAVPLAWAIHRRVARWRALTLAWSSLGLLDALGALTLGVGSAAASPLRFIYESPDSSVMGTLPWLLVPGFLMPIYILTHFAIFAQLVVDARRAGDRQ